MGEDTTPALAYAGNTPSAGSVCVCVVLCVEARYGSNSTSVNRYGSNSTSVNRYGSNSTRVNRYSQLECCEGCHKQLCDYPVLFRPSPRSVHL